MYSRKAPEEWRKRPHSRKRGNESNDIEELSSQSFGGDSTEHSIKSHKTSRVSSSSSRKERRTDDDTDFSDVRRKRGISSKRKVKSGSRESVQEILSDEVYDDKEDDTSEYKKRTKRRKSKKRNDNHSHDSTGERDSSVKRESTKTKRKKRHEEEEKQSELPITEILKKAREHRTKYEEPVPLPELTTDTIYVQGRNGFSAVKITGGGKQSRRNSEAQSPKKKRMRPIKVAIVFQRLWRSCGFVSQGLLGGMAMLHFIFIKTYFDYSEDFVNNYSALSEIYTCTFSFLIAMSIISTFDKFDIAYIGREHLSKIFKYHLKAILAIPLYIIAFTLHQVTMKIDDKLTLLHYNSSNITYYLFGGYNDTHGDIEVDELKTWQRMTLSKDALAVLGWIFVSFGNRKDMLEELLEAMNKYVENASPSM